MGEKYPKTGEIIYLLGVGLLLASSIVMPGAVLVAKEIIKIKKESDWQKGQKEWRKFNLAYLKRNLKRLREQKIIEFVKEGNNEIIRLTSKGRIRYLRFKMEELSIKSTKWDGKWRLVVYDIAKFKKSQQEKFRTLLRAMNFLPLQKSVYLTPYPCDEQIIYLREYFGIGDEVIYLRADIIENESIYRQYFGV